MKRHTYFNIETKIFLFALCALLVNKEDRCSSHSIFKEFKSSRRYALAILWFLHFITALSHYYLVLMNYLDINRPVSNSERLRNRFLLALDILICLLFFSPVSVNALLTISYYLKVLWTSLQLLMVRVRINI